MTRHARAKVSPGVAARISSRLSTSLRSGPLGDRNFRLLVGGQTTSTLGDFCYAVALPWMVLSARGGSVALLGLVLACYGIPRTALIPVGGILADKVGARSVMLTADAVRCLLVCALIYLDLQHLVSLAALGPVAALIGACGGLFIPASYTLLPQLLPSDQLQAGNAISSAGNQLGGFAGPALAGGLVAAFQPAAAFAVDAATFAVSAATLLMIRSGRQLSAAAGGQDERQDEDPYGNGLRQGTPADATGGSSGASRGLRQLLREPVLQITMAVALVANLVLTGTFEVAMPDLAHMRYGAAGYGAMLACFGAGATVGALLAARRTTRRAPAITACRVFILAAVGVALVPYLGGLPGACASILALAVGTAFGDIILITLMQQWAPPDQIGRVMSMIMLASMGVFPLSVAAAGFLVHSFGPVVFFPAGAVVLVLAVLGALSRREIRTLGVQDDVPAGEKEPLPAAG